MTGQELIDHIKELKGEKLEIEGSFGQRSFYFSHVYNAVTSDGKDVIDILLKMEKS